MPPQVSEVKKKFFQAHVEHTLEKAAMMHVRTAHGGYGGGGGSGPLSPTRRPKGSMLLSSTMLGPGNSFLCFRFC